VLRPPELDRTRAGVITDGCRKACPGTGQPKQGSAWMRRRAAATASIESRCG